MQPFRCWRNRLQEPAGENCAPGGRARRDPRALRHRDHLKVQASWLPSAHVQRRSARRARLGIRALLAGCACEFSWLSVLRCTKKIVEPAPPNGGVTRGPRGPVHLKEAAPHVSEAWHRPWPTPPLTRTPARPTLFRSEVAPGGLPGGLLQPAPDPCHHRPTTSTTLAVNMGSSNEEILVVTFQGLHSTALPPSVGLLSGTTQHLCLGCVAPVALQEFPSRPERKG